jgi:dicarboxylate transporter DctA-like protein
LPKIAATLHVDHVDLAEITKLLSIDGLTGTGQLDGAIPIVLDGGKVAISGGKLTARAPGVLGYKPSNLPPEIAGAGESVAMALQALSDFHYDRLTLDLDKSSSGNGTVLLKLEGRNPAFMSGQAFNFNIRVDSNFDQLAGYVLLGLRSAQDLLRRAAERTGP